jgi:hypothetical protein
MRSARAAHTATALGDGRVLVVGGVTRDETTAAGAELFDPGSGSFAATGSMITPRHSHTATLLADGRVLVAGGYNAQGEYLQCGEIFNPASGTFLPTGSLNVARAGHVAVSLEDGGILLIGGVGRGWEFLSGVEFYDQASGTFHMTGSMGSPREGRVAVRLLDGRVLVAGGHQGRLAGIHLHASAEMYNPATGEFHPVGSMSVPRHKHDGVLLQDGRVLITGGSDERDGSGDYASAEVYDPETGSFSAIPDMHLPRYKHQGTSVLLEGGRVLLAGGAAQAEVFDPLGGAFVLVGGEDRLAGLFSASAALGDGSVLITRGYGEKEGPQSSAWLYRP